MRLAQRPQPFLGFLYPRLELPHRRLYSRPSVAPKPAIDIKHIRNNPGLYSQNCEDRNYNSLKENSWKILDLFTTWQRCQQEARGLRERRNLVRHKLSNAASTSGDVEKLPESEDRASLLIEAKELKEKLSGMEAQEASLKDEMESLAVALPNLTSIHTPVGNVPDVLGYINEHPENTTMAQSDRVWRSHAHIGSELHLMDFAAAANTSGWGWYFMVNEGALLEQALIQYALSVARKYGWMTVSPPSIVYGHIAAACGFQPRDQNGEQQIYAIQQPDKDRAKPPLVLAGTAEIPLAGMKANDVIEDSTLPLKYVGVSRAYRAEAGARGVDTKGLYRVHEFNKVELFAWTLPNITSEEHFVEATPTQSDGTFQEMLAMQTEILRSLDLHCRILEMPSTDLGASATRKIDIEAFFPSRRDKEEGWGEVSSLSLCTDYQSRRLHTRVRLEKQGRRLDFPHTLNGTALAVPRVIAAIIENGWDERGQFVRVPEVLRPWMDGMEIIEKKHK
jgi:seryl-tRNA synthetase